MSGRLSGTYDPDSFLIFGIRVCVNDKKDGDRTDHSDSVPALFTVFKPIRDDNVQGIVPNTPREIKGDTVAREVLPRFLRIARLKLDHDQFLVRI